MDAQESCLECVRRCTPPAPAAVAADDKRTDKLLTAGANCRLILVMNICDSQVILVQSNCDCGPRVWCGVVWWGQGARFRVQGTVEGPTCRQQHTRARVTALLFLDR